MENITLSKSEKYNKNTDSARQISSDVTMLVSGMIRKDGKTFVRVSFLRGKSWAEGIVPEDSAESVIEKSEGFSEEELVQLREYLIEEKDTILKQAKGVNPLKNMFGI